MIIESIDYLDRPADEVYPLVRDHLTELLPYLPDVESIEQKSYVRESDDRVRVVNIWKAKAKVPSFVAKMIPPDLFVWTDRALWKSEDYSVDYELEGFCYRVTGTNTFGPKDGGTELRISGTVEIYPEKLKIPKLLWKKAYPMIEGSIKNAVQPNLTSLARGLRAYFEAQKE